MPYNIARLQGDIAQVQHVDAGFGTGRLIARNLILTAAHVLWRSVRDRRAGVPQKVEGWQVRLVKQQLADMWPFQQGNSVVWHDQINDLALIQLSDPDGHPLDPPHTDRFGPPAWQAPATAP